eukprot:gene24834-10485_t
MSQDAFSRVMNRLDRSHSPGTYAQRFQQNCERTSSSAAANEHSRTPMTQAAPPTTARKGSKLTAPWVSSKPKTGFKDAELAGTYSVAKLQASLAGTQISMKASSVAKTYQDPSGSGSTAYPGPDSDQDIPERGNSDSGVDDDEEGQYTDGFESDGSTEEEQMSFDRLQEVEARLASSDDALKHMHASTSRFAALEDDLASSEEAVKKLQHSSYRCLQLEGLLKEREEAAKKLQAAKHAESVHGQIKDLEKEVTELRQKNWKLACAQEEMTAQLAESMDVEEHDTKEREYEELRIQLMKQQEDLEAFSALTDELREEAEWAARREVDAQAQLAEQHGAYETQLHKLQAQVAEQHDSYQAELHKLQADLDSARGAGVRREALAGPQRQLQGRETLSAQTAKKLESMQERVDDAERVTVTVSRSL